VLYGYWTHGHCTGNTAVAFAEVHLLDMCDSPNRRGPFERVSYAPADRGTESNKGSEHETLVMTGLAAFALAIVSSFAVSSSSAVAAALVQVRHELLISVDGMHQSDLDWYVTNHPTSELARLATGGAEYTDAQTSDPSDSDPGGTAIMTGGDPKVTGIYYDDEYSHGVFPPGTTNCSGPVRGGDVIYDSPDDTLPAVPDLLHNGSGNSFPSFDESGSIYPGEWTRTPA
jgi:hypothetical protein